jgi:hypothetical protein
MLWTPPWSIYNLFQTVDTPRSLPKSVSNSSRSFLSSTVTTNLNQHARLSATSWCESRLWIARVDHGEVELVLISPARSPGIQAFMGGVAVVTALTGSYFVKRDALKKEGKADPYGEQIPLWATVAFQLVSL